MEAVCNKLSRAPQKARRAVRWMFVFACIASQAGAETQFSSVVDPGKPISPGDLVRTTVYFGAWNLICDTLRSTKRRVCVIEQSLADASVSLQWRIGITAQGKPALAFDISNSVDRQEGLVFRVGKFMTTIPLEDCQAVCRAVIPFDGFVQDGVLGGEVVGFGYTKNGQGAAIAADMRGFKDVLAASQNPPSVSFDGKKPKARKPAVSQ